MSDSQVLEYVKDGIRQGKEQKQLASELARRGVTKEQATRVKQLYEQQNNVNASNATGTDVNESRLREEMKENTSNMLEDHPSTQDLARGNQVFGRNIFNTRNLTFEPSVNIATPLNYRLGPGDEVLSTSGEPARTLSANIFLLTARSKVRLRVLRTKKRNHWNKSEDSSIRSYGGRCSGYQCDISHMIILSPGICYFFNTS